jgi:hypothetical protein
MAIVHYSTKEETMMQQFYHGLNEKEKRHYVAVESMKFGHGAQQYLCDLFGICHATIRRGVWELSDSALLGEISINKQRRSGGGRKKNPRNTSPTN